MKRTSPGRAPSPLSSARKVLYLDCFAGLSGDMFLGLAVDLGVKLAWLRRELGRLKLPGYRVASRSVDRGGLSATQVLVKVAGMKGADPGLHAHRRGGHHSDHHHHEGDERTLPEIRAIIQRSRLPERVKQRAVRVFTVLVEAEARVHRVPPAKVHLHEAGAVDAIVDIVGACLCLEALGVERLICSPLPMGSGTIHCAHGILPVPAPATVEILKGRPVYGGEFTGELVTPTGAALACALADQFGPLPPMKAARVGHGAGSRDPEDHPNLLRGVLGELDDPAALLEKVIVIETTIDDLNPQVYGYLMERLFAAGALEVFFAPIQMKKNRPGTLVTLIVPEERFEAIAEVVFRETTTIGFRYQRMDRIELGREIRRVRTRYGPIRIKVSLFLGRVVQATPEYEDCRTAALKASVPLREVQRAAAEVFHRS